MEFRYQYHGTTQVSDGSQSQAFSFAPDLLRPQVAFDGLLRRDSGVHWPVREALLALHDVVVSDLRVRGRDRTAYRAWLADNEQHLLARFMQRGTAVRARLDEVQRELQAVRAQKSRVVDPFYRARAKYFSWLYMANRDAWFVLDPVITVHPERVLFEAFSQDESSYCAVSISHNAFTRTGEVACGTTNIDYSVSLYDEFQKIRDYRDTRIAIDPAGFAVQAAGDPERREDKIDLPESWLAGFLQVSSASALPATVLELHPMDLHSVLSVLRQQRETAGPRALRIELAPRAAPTLVFEPWNLRLPTRRSQLVGPALTEPQTIRLWGRRRLLTLERLIAVAQRVRVHLLGTGMPSFWVIELGEVTVTLGLSGWTSNDWASAAKFALLTPRQALPPAALNTVAQALQARWMASVDELAAATQLGAGEVRAALTAWAQAGRAVYDLPQGRWAWRELLREPLTPGQLRLVSPEDDEAVALVASGGVQVHRIDFAQGFARVAGQVPTDRRTHDTVLELSADDVLTDARCDCNHHQQHGLRRGPCVHMLALRLVAQAPLDQARAQAATASAVASATPVTGADA